MVPPSSSEPRRELLAIVGVWLAVSSILTLLALRNLSSPGLFYDEAVFAGMAKDFLTGNTHGLHMSGTKTVDVLGRPFPLFVQSYLGAVKSWMIIPSFVLFGPSVAVLRLTMLFWCSISVLLCMLWTRKLLGLPSALLVALVLALDPSFYFISVLEWGSVIPSFLCRFGGFYLLILWWREHRIRHGFLAAVCLGIGFFNKIDFVVILIGCGIAVAITYGKEVLASIRRSRSKWGWYCLGFVIGAGPMIMHLRRIVENVSGRVGLKSGDDLLKELLEKIHTARAMYNGSYFFRMMEVGGRLETMFARPSAVWSLFGWAVILSGVLLAAAIVCRKGDVAERRRRAFLLLSTILVSVGVVLLPGAVRIHHAALVYPFPHLLVIAAAVMLWPRSPLGSVAKWGARTCVVGMMAIVIGGHLVAILKTQDLIAATGGRGYWSDAILTFCNQMKAEPDVAVVSLDWGFNEQVDFLCDPRPLSEPIWANRAPVVASKTVYLMHPPQYIVFPTGQAFYAAVRDKFRGSMSIQAYRDRQGKVVFYALRLYGVEAGWKKRDEEVEAAIARLQAALDRRPDSAEDHLNLGALMEGRGRVAEAIAHYQRATELMPDDAEARYNLGVALYHSGMPVEAVRHLRDAIRFMPDNFVFVNRLAWVLATCPEPSVRDGAQAVRLAQALNLASEDREPRFLGTLAAAYAEVGEFTQAIEAAERAVTLASASGDKVLADTLRLHIHRYQAGSAYHEMLTGQGD